MAGTDQRPGDMFIEHPDEVKIERDDGAVATFCWLDHDRICTGGCQAFDPDYASDETGRFTNCRLINISIAASSAFSHFVREMTKPSKPLSRIQDVPGVSINPPEVK